MKFLLALTAIWAALALPPNAIADNNVAGVTAPTHSHTEFRDYSSAVTRWPIVFSHAWSRVADSSFQGDDRQAAAKYDQYGVKRDLESLGVTVFQPNKLAYASHENRGRLLYKKCAGFTLKTILCEGKNPKVVDGIHQATLRYCEVSSNRQRHGFKDQENCHKGLQFNIICHSQGCPDSRYMLSAVTNEFSGKPMYMHIASWTSMAGANKGTSLADSALEPSPACPIEGCRLFVLNVMAALDSIFKNRALIANGSESVIALSRQYMLVSTDMDCSPGLQKNCAPSFNELYPLPEDPKHPILYQTFSTQIYNIDHPCYDDNRAAWAALKAREGENDGYISVDSQQFISYGLKGAGGTTPVVARSISGTSTDATHPHPGLDHMAFNNSDVPGLTDLSCAAEDNSAFNFSRIELYRNVIGELASWGY